MDRRNASVSSRLSIEHLTVQYAGVTAVDDVSFDLQPGEFMSLLGPSGSGKTTILKTIAGFEEASAGRVAIDDQTLNDLPARFRNIGMVFQSYALFPHMTVRRNVAFGLRARQVSKQALDAHVDEILEVVGLSPYRDRFPPQLSGGQQQRVALARAIVIRPRLLLMDEPLAALDLRLRQQLQLEIRRIQQQFGITTLYVTHDQEEALTLSDRVVVMDSGHIAEIGAPSAVYHRPSTHFGACFVGNKSVIPVPQASIIDNKQIRGIAGQQDAIEFDAPDGAYRAYVVLEPEVIRCTDANSPNVIHGVIMGSRFLGRSILYSVQAGDQQLLFTETGMGFRQGDTVALKWSSASAHVVCEKQT